MDALTLTPVTDLDTFAAMLARWRPDRAVSAEVLRQREQERQPGEYVGRFLAERGGKRVGLGNLEYPRTENQSGWLNLTVGAAELALLSSLVELGIQQAREAGAATVIARVQEDRPELAAYEAAEFTEYDRMFGSRLDLGTLDFGRFAHKEKAVQDAGLHIFSLTEVLGENGFHEVAQRKLYGLICSRLGDVPGTANIHPWPFEVWQERVGAKVDPAGVFIAVTADGEWVGLTELFLELEPGVLHTGLTGVEPQWQGQGVAYALKLAALRSAKARGYTSARTSNHVRNAPMLAVNRALGFVPDPATVMLKRTL